MTSICSTVNKLFALVLPKKNKVFTYLLTNKNLGLKRTKSCILDKLLIHIWTTNFSCDPPNILS